MSNNSKKPTHYVYQVSRKDADDKGHWTRIGAAWKHQDNEGFTLRVAAMPLSGELVVRTPLPEDASA